MSDSENSQGPKKDPLSIVDNPYGHQMGPGRKTDRGYARCRWCDCRESTPESAQLCVNAVETQIGGGPPRWSRRSL